MTVARTSPRQDGKYDLIWFVAPDSYAANNAASSGAFVLSESYLYTTEMIRESLEHLTDRGMMVVQFGELDYRGTPNRTARYVMTARKAFHELGVKDPGAHMIVSPYITNARRPVDDHAQADAVHPGGGRSVRDLARTGAAVTGDVGAGPATRRRHRGRAGRRA